MGTAEAVVLVPVKAFGQAKKRLSAVLSPVQRAELARSMAEHVLGAARPLPVAVVCDNAEVAQWADDLGAMVLPEPGRGLNGAVEAAVQALGERGFQRVIVAHSDLPLAQSLAWLADRAGIIIVPDRHQQGTNVMSLPAGCQFRFSYGPGSFRRHLSQALDMRMPVQVVHDENLGWDIDMPADMAVLAQ